MRNELGQSVDHFKRAATIAAHETSATVAPTINAARERVQPAATAARDAAAQSWDSALAALVAASENVRHAGKTVSRKEKKKARKLQRKADKAFGHKPSRAGQLAGYALLGTAIGISAAYLVRRRREAQWAEYEPGPHSGGADDAAFEPMEPTVYTTSNGTVSDQTKQTPR
ncbi:hypothetical protein GCM10010112_74970 [Actinoplanes lobatus]|uniref:Uncharacterized protein n=1 Tax=Actinoplanes lobatus TaxID=113568 RepID=A0A7W7MEZ3_9ACTN|nr:ESPR-type extended signal peptide-containing protein [Actinoplanes lobatus]MBB4747797.1 hypothetical protein [Actinoplanes lobatus]GGN89978.1 hypothetical protein GCM10010112_74970 [Actinoplanes lobatus]GIE43772.1 hypothetical protein Alo02nite_66700 [Actinoplanes lobatus]